MEFNIRDDEFIDYREKAGETEAVIPADVKEISFRAFARLRYLNRIVIGRKVTKISHAAFYDCTALNHIEVSAFNQSYASRNGVLYDKTFTHLIFCPSGIGRFQIPDTVREIEGSAFSGGKDLTEVSVSGRNSYFVLHDDILYTGDRKTLLFCPRNRTSVIIPDSVTTIAEYAFEYCQQLTDVKFPANLKLIHKNAFRWCDKLEDVTFPSGLKMIHDSAFEHCHSLKHIIIPNGTESLIASAFSDCKNLESVVIPQSVTHVGHLFSSCGKLKHLTCHGIEVHETNHMSRAAWMIVHKDYEEKLPDSLRYDIIFQLFLANPDDNSKESAYLKEHFLEMMFCFMDDNQIVKIKLVMQTMRKYFNHQNIDEMIQYAIENQYYEIQIMLTDYKARRIGYPSQETMMKKFDL